MRTFLLPMLAVLTLSACATDDLEIHEGSGDDITIRADSFVSMHEIDAFAEQACSGDRAVLMDRQYRDTHPDSVFWSYRCFRTPLGLKRLQDQR